MYAIKTGHLSVEAVPSVTLDNTLRLVQYVLTALLVGPILIAILVLRAKLANLDVLQVQDR
jgi:DMSO reductase anchor subunit